MFCVSNNKHAKKLSEGNLLEQLAAIPVARPGMTEDELRQICVDYIKLETEFPFKLEEEFQRKANISRAYGEYC